MRYRAIVVGVYLTATLIWIYGPVSDTEPASVWLLLAVIALQVTFGAVVGQWWACLTPLILIPAAVPAGYGGGGDIPVWFGVLLQMPLAVALVGIGDLVRRVVADLMREGAREPRHSPGNGPPAA